MSAKNMVCAYNLYRVYKFTNNVEKAVGIGMCMCFHLVKYNLVFIHLLCHKDFYFYFMATKN